MSKVIRELNLDLSAQIVSFRKNWEVTQVEIITLDGVDVGWMQSSIRGDAIFLAQLFVETPVQRRGIGTETMRHLIEEASRARRAVELGVVKINPALSLYQSLGFRITHEDERKFYMRREPGTVATGTRE